MSVALLPAKSRRATGLRCYNPPAKDVAFVDDAIAFLQMTASFWPAIIYKRMTIKFTRDVPFMATDGYSIFVNVDGCRAAGWGLEEMAFVLAHEACHYVFGDLLVNALWVEAGVVQCRTRTLPFDHDLMNRAKDYRINAALIESGVGRFPRIGLFDAAISAKGMEDCVDIYDRLWTLREQRKRDEPGETFDEHLEPSDEDAKAEAKTGEADREEAIAGAMQTAKIAGHEAALPGVIRQLVGDMLNPKVKWQDHLRATMMRSAGERRNDWAKVNRRMISRPVGGRIVFAGKSVYGCGTVVIGWDTSGSTHEYQNLFFNEMAGIVADLNPAELIVVRCDAAVHNVDELAEPEDLLELRDKVNDMGIGGGGGTRFEPVFDYIRENFIEPDMLVYFTDLLGSFPKQVPDYPVIWANIEPDMSAPFGTIVNIEKE
jgi:VWA-like domain (DUF2201)/Putative metallopeptidase domain